MRPWQDRDLDLQAGLVPPVFGSFARRRYASDDPLPSLPLVNADRWDAGVELRVGLRPLSHGRRRVVAGHQRHGDRHVQPRLSFLSPRAS